MLIGGNRTSVNATNGKARFDSVIVGNHTVIETVPTGWSLMNVTPSNGTVKNNGTVAVNNVTVTDTLPPEVIVIDDGDADNHSGNKLEWEIGDIDSGDDWTVRYRVSVSSSAFPGQILRNEVCAKDDEEEIDQCESVTVAVIGNLPQTGVLGGGITASSVKLKSIRMGGSGDSSGDPLAPLAAWISIVGVGVGLGMGAGRRLLIGF